MIYHNIGDVNFPVHDRDPSTNKLLWPNQRSGITTVRLVVEDLTVDWRNAIQQDFQPYAEDFLVGVDGMPDVRQAFEYFSQADHRYVENVLIGTINWSGGRPPIYWKAARTDLGEAAIRLWDMLETHQYAGSKVHLVTSLNQKPATVQRLAEEAQRLKLSVRDIAWELPHLCQTCGATKPQVGARRIGWRRAPDGRWQCGAHNAA